MGNFQSPFQLQLLCDFVVMIFLSAEVHSHQSVWRHQRGSRCPVVWMPADLRLPECPSASQRNHSMLVCVPDYKICTWVRGRENQTPRNSKENSQSALQNTAGTIPMVSTSTTQQNQSLPTNVKSVTYKKIVTNIQKKKAWTKVMARLSCFKLEKRFLCPSTLINTTNGSLTETRGDGHHCQSDLPFTVRCKRKMGSITSFALFRFLPLHRIAGSGCSTR